MRATLATITFWFAAVVATSAGMHPVPQNPLYALSENYEVVSFDIMLDGGSIIGRIEDEDGVSLEFCGYGPMVMVGREPKYRPGWYVGGRYPSVATALFLDPGSAEKQLLMLLLRRWSEQKLSHGISEKEIALYNTNNSSEERRALLERLSETKKRALHINRRLFRSED